MERLVVLLVVFVILAALLVLSRRKGRSEQVRSVVYERRHLFGKDERAFLAVLDEAAGDRARAFGKVRLGDLLQVPAAMASGVRRDAQNAIAHWRVDFVLCDTADLRVLAVVELDEASPADRADERDAIMAAALGSAGIPVIRFAARSGYAVAEVRRRIDPVLAAVPPAAPSARRTKAAKGKAAASRTTPVPSAETLPAVAPAPAPAPASAPTPTTVAATRAAASVAPRPPSADGESSPYARLGTCPTCGRPMVERIGKRGAMKGKPFLVCGGDPPCGTVVADD